MIIILPKGLLTQLVRSMDRKSLGEVSYEPFLNGTNKHLEPGFGDRSSIPDLAIIWRKMAEMIIVNTIRVRLREVAKGRNKLKFRKSQEIIVVPNLQITIQRMRFSTKFTATEVRRRTQIEMCDSGSAIMES